LYVVELLLPRQTTTMVDLIVMIIRLMVMPLIRTAACGCATVTQSQRETPPPVDASNQ